MDLETVLIKPGNVLLTGDPAKIHDFSLYPDNSLATKLYALATFAESGKHRD